MCDTRVTKSWPWSILCMKYTNGTKVRIDGSDLLDCILSPPPCMWRQHQRWFSTYPTAKFLIVLSLQDSPSFAQGKEQDMRLLSYATIYIAPVYLLQIYTTCRFCQLHLDVITLHCIIIMKPLVWDELGATICSRSVHIATAPVAPYLLSKNKHHVSLRTLETRR